MSHFTTLVLIPADRGDELTDEVDRLLAPYDENLEIPEYDKPCYCIGSVAHRRAREAAAAKCGTIGELRESFYKSRVSPGGLLDDDGSATEAAWREHIRPYEAVEKASLESDPDREKPDPECDECGGTGTYRSTLNPRAQWDWFTIGGRWNGRLGSYDPAGDPANWETCWLCRGTGVRADGLVVADGCNACGGTGKALKYPSNQVHKGNTCPVERIPADFVPFALVTPDGKWYQQAEMGWWGMTSGDKPEDVWAAEFRVRVAEHPGTIAVLVDCHI